MTEEKLDDKFANGSEKDDSILKGIRCGAVLRPEPLFHRQTRLIIDTHYNANHNILRNGLEQTEFEHINLISLEKLFDNKNEVFLGFGIPNVYLTIPNEKYDGYVKFAAFMLWRQASAIVPTKDRVQSGFLIRFRGLSKDTIEIIRQSMIKNSNQRNISCAHANACVLTSAGFTSGSRSLQQHFGARALFQQIYEFGLEFQGKPFVLDFIRTTPLTLEEHFHEVRKKELTSLGRTYKKVMNECSPGEKSRAPLLPADQVPTNPIIQSEANSLIRLEISRPGRFGAIIRKIWGSHTLFKLIPNRNVIDINNYLPDTLLAFPNPNPDFFTRLKKTFLFSRFVVTTIRTQMTKLWDNHGEFSSQLLPSMMSISSADHPHIYNIVMTGNHFLGMHDNPLLKLKSVHWILSKHVLISGYDDDVRFAGEAWMEHRSDGVIFHLTNNSGTYRPSEQHLIQAAKFLSDALPGLNVETHKNSIPPPASLAKDQRQKNFFNWKILLIILLPIIVWWIYAIFK